MYAGKKTETSLETVDETHEELFAGPKTIPAFLPVVVPILLMALRSVLVFDKNKTGFLTDVFNIAGDPAVALAIGVLIAIATGKNTKHSLAFQLSAAVEKAGGILVIIGAGGAFGAVLAATNIGDHFSEKLDLKMLGIFFPFLIAVSRSASSSFIEIS